MSSTKSRIELLKEAMRIEEERAAIEGRLARLETRRAQVHGMLFGRGAVSQEVARRGPAKAAAKTSKGSKGRGMKRGKLTAAILGALKSAGGKGLRVADLAKRFNANPRNIFVWFSTTAKKFRGIRKVSPGLYSFRG